MRRTMLVTVQGSRRTESLVNGTKAGFRAAARSAVIGGEPRKTALFRGEGGWDIPPERLPMLSSSARLVARTLVLVFVGAYALVAVGCGDSYSTGPRCGNGEREEGEECDGEDLAGQGCGSLGLEDGTLGCSESCTYDVSQCTGSAECGNGAAEYPEQCDATDLAGTTCEDLGFDAGSLACAADCTFETAGCVQIAECGDGVAEGAEECDEADLDGADCESLGLEGGSLTCAADCTYDVSGCTGTAECGNDAREHPEQCDGADLGGATCEDQGFDGGTLACAGDCTFDTSGCEQCGDGVVQAGEACDGTDLGGHTCESEGFGGGTLTCGSDCTLDTSGCVAETTPVCTPAPPATQVDEGGGPVVLTFTCTDADGDLLSVASTDSSGLPDGGVSFADDGPANGITVTVTLDPDSDDAGPTGHVSFEAAFTVADPQANAVTVIVPVTFDNLPVTFTPDPVPNQVVTVGETLDVVVTFDDGDGDSLSFTPSLPGYGSLATAGSVATLTFAPTSAADDSGSPDAVSLQADDPQDGTVTASFTVEVNQAPVADAGPDVTAAPDSVIGLDGTGSVDPDGDPLTYQWTPGAGAPALDDPTSATPSLVGGACGETYTYTLVVNDGYVDSAPDTVVVTLHASGPYVSEADCTPGDECGDLSRPWCTITGGVEAARTHAYPQIYVKEGEYTQGTTATVDETLVIQPTASATDCEILGGYTDLATLARASGPSCDTATPGSGATVVWTNTPRGVQFTAGSQHRFDGFCVRAQASATSTPRQANLTVEDAAPTLAHNIVDAVSASAADETAGILVLGNDPSAPAAPVIHHNVDVPADGLYFGGNGVNAAIGIAVDGAADVYLHHNSFTGGGAAGGSGSQLTVGVLFDGQGQLRLEDNVLAGGDGATAAVGLVARQTGGPLSVTAARNDLAGGTSPGRAVGARIVGVSMALVTDHNRVDGRLGTGGGLVAHGLVFEGVADARVNDRNDIHGGQARNEANGIRSYGGTSLVVTDTNTVRGGLDGGTGSAELVGIRAEASPLLVVSTGNTVSGAEVDSTTGLPVAGGRYVHGVSADGMTEVTLADNDALIGGAPAGSTLINTDYQATGVRLLRPDTVSVSGNTLLQGCLPRCGPGDQPPMTGLQPATGAGVLVQGRGGGGTKVITANDTIMGGPVSGAPLRTYAVGVDVRGPTPSGSSAALAVEVSQNVALSGNVEPDTATDTNRPRYAIGLRAHHAQVTVEDNGVVRGGRADQEAVGLQLTQSGALPTSAHVVENGAVYGNPFTDYPAQRPFAVYGIRSEAQAGGTLVLWVAGTPTVPQEVGGGFARPNVQGTAVGIRALRAAQVEIDHNRIWGGVVPGGLTQRGLWLEHPATEAQVRGNRIEACGPLLAGSSVHHPDCEQLWMRSEGLYLVDGVGMPTWVYNNLVFGGFSQSGSTGVRIDDSGNNAAQVKLYNNYVNAQGLFATSCAATGPDARAVELRPSSGSINFGDGIELHNNILDGGGRTCTRYGVYEANHGGVGDVFRALVVSHNLWVQVLPGRDNNPAGAVTWGYHESTGANWCEAGVDTIGPAGCLSDPTAPTTASLYTDSREGDPVFEGVDTAISERPGELPLSDFHATGADLQSTGDCGAAVVPFIAEDYEGDTRPNLPTCDLGHDETL